MLIRDERNPSEIRGPKNKGRFCNNNENDTLISKWVSVENKAKLSQLEIVKKTILRRRCFELPIERVLLCSLQIIALKFVCRILILLQNLPLFGSIGLAYCRYPTKMDNIQMEIISDTYFTQNIYAQNVKLYTNLDRYLR